MRILSVHTRYAQRGGEDQVREAERDLLRQHEHTVIEYVQDNESIRGSLPWTVGARTLWSNTDYRLIREAIRTNGIQLVHVHNFFPLISPAVYYAAHAERVPVVQTLHNYRLICPAATLLRNGELCELCVGRTFALPGVQHACYRGSTVLSAGVAAMSSLHRIAHTWDHMVTRYIALTEFMKDRYVAGGFPAEKIVVKPNFTVDTGKGSGEGEFFLFVGRLSAEKGAATLLKAWAAATDQTRKLLIIGTGPEELNLRAQAANLRSVQFLGQQSREVVDRTMGEAAAVLVPSIWHEPFGLTIIEAYAKGTPVIATNLGGMSSLVKPGVTGELFERGDVRTLAELLRTWTPDPALRAGARQSYESHYTPSRNYEELMDIYRVSLGVSLDEG